MKIIPPYPPFLKGGKGGFERYLQVKIHKRTEGQTLIETAIVLFLLLLILLGITEFARAWYTKNSLKNAVRHGVRIAVVTPKTPAPGFNPTVVPPPPPPPPVGTYSNCQGHACPSTLTNNNEIIDAVCCSSGVQNRNFNDPDGGTRVSLTYIDEDGSTTLTTGDTILVSAQTNFKFIVGDSPWPWARIQTFTAEASMRYEL
jgi:hypothetical protein